MYWVIGAESRFDFNTIREIKTFLKHAPDNLKEYKFIITKEVKVISGTPEQCINKLNKKKETQQ
jgi:hypothetical protein